jgi:hypothetical protein
MKILLLSALVAVLALVGVGLARPGNVDKIPNGEVYSCDTCHTDGGGSPRNSFGLDFQANGGVWNSALAVEDSDGGGATNGLELLDPEGEWSQGDPDPGDPDDVTNPGDPEDDVQIGIEDSTWGRIKSDGP